MNMLLRETGQMIRFNYKNLLLFVTGYRMVTAAVYFQLLNVSVRFALRQAGYSYLTLENAGKVLLSPWTFPVVLLMAGTGLLLLMIEAGGLVAAYWGAACSLKLSAIQILLQGLRNGIWQIRDRNFRLFAVAGADFFLLNLFYLYRTLTHVKPVNFVLEEILAYVWGKAAVFLLLVLCISAVIPSYFVFHECMIEQKSYNDGRDKSRQLLKGRYVRTVVRVVCPQILLIGAAAASYVLLVFVMAVFAVLFVRRELEFAFLIRAADWCEGMVMAAASVISSLLYFADLSVQFYRYGDNQIGRRHFFDPGGALLSRKNGLAVLGAAGLIGGLGLLDGAVNGSFLDSSVVVQTEITAHRGSSRAAPENTMAALFMAVEEMADWAEIDVQETLDGVVVVCHDTDLKRVAGTYRRVSDLTYEELKGLDAGAWFSPEYEGERIPALEEVMEYAKGKIKLNIELKYSGPESSLPHKVLELIEYWEMEEQCIVTCTNAGYLYRIKEINPQVKTGYIIPAAYGDYYMDSSADVISIRSGFVTKRLVTWAHEAGKSVYAWTVNDKRELERMRVLGVDNVITDVPVLAREILYREEATENLLEYLRMLIR